MAKQDRKDRFTQENEMVQHAVSEAGPDVDSETRAVLIAEANKQVTARSMFGHLLGPVGGRRLANALNEGYDDVWESQEDEPPHRRSKRKRSGKRRKK